MRRTISAVGEQSLSEVSALEFRNGKKERIRVACSAKWYEFPGKFDAAVESGLCLEYTPDMRSLEDLPEHLSPYLNRDVPIRHHAFFPGLELGDRDKERATLSYELHRKMLETIAGYGERFMTVHIGLDPGIELVDDRAVHNLGLLVERAAALDITLSLENLRRGRTSDPHLVLDWASRAGAALTLDIGHVLCSEFTRNGGPDIFEVIRLFGPRLAEVHFYEREADRHYPPGDMTVLGPIVDALVNTACSWWTIELESIEEVRATCALLKEHGRTSDTATLPVEYSAG